jgi:DNA-binding beta-propeller fold protein YncE
VLARTLAVAALLAPLAGPARAASPARGLTHERSIYSDSAEVTLKGPEGVACDDRGTIVVADTGNGRLLLYSWKDGNLDGGTQLRIVQASYPVRVQIDSKGFVLVLDRRTRRIVKLDTKGAFAAYVDAQGASSPVTPASIKLDPSDNLYILDVVAGRVVVLSPDGKVTRELPLPQGAKGVTDVAAESSGKIYVVDAPSATVFVAEAADQAFKPLSASLKESISFPGYLAADNHGKLLVVDQSGGAVVRLGNDGSFQGRDLALGWMDGTLQYPAQLCLTGPDIVVADRGNNRVQIFAMPK